MFTSEARSILGVSDNAPEAEIKAAFTRLAKQYHPDRNPGNKAAEEKFKKVGEARDVLVKYLKTGNVSNDEARAYGQSSYSASGNGSRYNKARGPYADYPDLAAAAREMDEMINRLRREQDAMVRKRYQKNVTVRVNLKYAYIGGEITADGITWVMPKGVRSGTYLDSKVNFYTLKLVADAPFSVDMPGYRNGDVGGVIPVEFENSKAGCAVKITLPDGQEMSYTFESDLGPGETVKKFNNCGIPARDKVSPEGGLIVTFVRGAAKNMVLAKLAPALFSRKHTNALDVVMAGAAVGMNFVVWDGLVEVGFTILFWAFVAPKWIRFAIRDIGNFLEKRKG